LIEAYSGRCAISACDAVQTLEAAHIMPYNGPRTNHPANGLLLTADLHVLFDLHLITIDPATLKVVLAPSLKNTTYVEYEGKVHSLPPEENVHPNRLVLEKHRGSSSV
jgi:putative restriction endonuclease